MTNHEPVAFSINENETKSAPFIDKPLSRDIINSSYTELEVCKNSILQSKEDYLEPYDPRKDLENYNYPTLDLLMKYENDGLPFNNIEEQQTNKNRIVDVLWSFGIVVSTIKATVGPRNTLYEITLAPGVNASKLRGLEDDIALALSSHNVQILIPIPGKGTIGIEVPNIRPLLFLWKVF